MNSSHNNNTLKLIIRNRGDQGNCHLASMIIMWVGFGSKATLEHDHGNKWGKTKTGKHKPECIIAPKISSSKDATRREPSSLYLLLFSSYPNLGGDKKRDESLKMRRNRSRGLENQTPFPLFITRSLDGSQQPNRKPFGASRRFDRGKPCFKGINYTSTVAPITQSKR